MFINIINNLDIFINKKLSQVLNFRLEYKTLHLSHYVFSNKSLYKNTLYFCLQKYTCCYIKIYKQINLRK